MNTGHGLASQRSCSREHKTNAVEVVLAAFLRPRDHLNENGRDNGQLLNLEPLDGFQELAQTEPGKDDELVAPIHGDVGYVDQPEDVAEREDAKGNLRDDFVLLSGDGVICGGLQRVGDDIVVGDHDSFLCAHIHQRSVTHKNALGSKRHLTGIPEVPLEKHRYAG